MRVRRDEGRRRRGLGRRSGRRSFRCRHRIGTDRVERGGRAPEPGERECERRRGRKKRGARRRSQRARRCDAWLRRRTGRLPAHLACTVRTPRRSTAGRGVACEAQCGHESSRHVVHEERELGIEGEKNDTRKACSRPDVASIARTMNSVGALLYASRNAHAICKEASINHTGDSAVRHSNGVAIVDRHVQIHAQCTCTAFVSRSFFRW